LQGFSRALALFKAYSFAGPVPRDVQKNYDDALKELQAIAEGKRPNLPKAVTPSQSVIAGSSGSDRKVHGRIIQRDEPR